jgi:hypothetical protein
MCAQMILHLVFHEGDDDKHLFIFNRPKNLDRNNFGEFNGSRKLMVEGYKYKYFVPKPCKRIELIFFTQNHFKVIINIVILKKMNCSINVQLKNKT